jgi:prepilin-type N-terminal cleavage/methylation domain-containing protein/prepilin-type processing-associated H-X9-DG protein
MLEQRLMQRIKAFTLVELLVVVAVIAVLIAILMPVLASARTAGKRVACRAQLGDIGRLFQMYLNDSKNKLPHANPIPSLTPALPGKPITEILERYTREVRAGWRCAADRITERIAGTPGGFETYFEREGISYFYHPRLGFEFAGRQLSDHPTHRAKKPNELWLFKDFESFHASRISNGSCNYLFADWHVGDLANEISRH